MDVCPLAVTSGEALTVNAHAGSPLISTDPTDTPIMVSWHLKEAASRTRATPIYYSSS